MSEPMKIFILEDDDKQITIYQDAIDAFKKKQEIDVAVTTSKKLDEALFYIKNESFDAAILDLKLSGTDTEGQGNKVIREIKENLRFPIYVVSGVLGQLDEDLKKPNIFYQISNRTDKTAEEIVQDIHKIYSTGITRILGKKGPIELALQDVFWKHFAVNKSFWEDSFIKDENCEKILLRHILECLTGYLESKYEEELVFYHPEEVYINPPIRKTPYTGDILKKEAATAGEEDYFIILTPPCDMTQAKAKEVVIGSIEKPTMECLQQQKRLIEDSEKEGAQPEDVEKGVDARKILENLLKNNHSLKYHFLPMCQSFRGGFINFQKINSVKYADINSHYQIVASIADSFVKDIIARFSHYYSRQGQPDFDIKELLKKVLKNGA